jgi:hypothetical protein
MACPGCLVAVAGTDGLGQTTSASTWSTGPFIAGLVIGGVVAFFFGKFGEREKHLGPDPHEVYRNNRRRRRR